MFRNGFFVGVCWFLLCSTAYAAPSTAIVITAGAEKLKQTLEAMPSTKIGQGEALYVFQFPDCSPCQAFYKDFEGQASGVQMRHFFYAVSQKSANETAALARRPRPNTYHMLMRQSQTVRPYDKGKKRIRAFNAVMEPLNDVIIPTLIENGWPKKNLVAPTFIWEENGNWYADGGYNRQDVEAILASVAGAATVVATQEKPAAQEKLVAQEPLSYAVKPGENFAGVEPVALAENLAAKSRLTPAEIIRTMNAIAVEDVGVDLRGLRLGMTPTEVMATLKETLPDYAIDPPRYNTVPLSVGLLDAVSEATVSTPGAYADKVRAINNVNKDQIIVEFALPPGANVAMSIQRNHNIHFSEAFKTKKTSVDVYRKALINRYGPPAAEYPHGAYGATLKWLYPVDGMDCIGGGRGATHAQSWVFRDTGKAAECATTLLYGYAAGSDGVVTAAGAKLANPGQWIFNLHANNALREEVRKLDDAAKREQATDTPDL